MSAAENFGSLVNLGFSLLGGLFLLICCAAVPQIFNGSATSAARFNAALTASYAFVFGLPITLGLMGAKQGGLGQALTQAAFYQTFVFGFAATYVLVILTNRLAIDVLGWFADDPVTPQSGFITLIEGLLLVAGSAVLGHYVWPAWGGLVGCVVGGGLAAFEHDMYKRKLASQALQASPAPVAAGPAPSHLIDVTPYAAPAATSAARPPKELGAGFDVPPQD